MKWQLFSGIFLIFSPALLASQVSLNSASSTITVDNQAALSQSGGQIVSLNGKVATEDGSAISNQTSVVLQCGNEERARVNTDHEGDFTMSLTIPVTGTARSESTRVQDQIASSTTALDLNQCELYGDAPGYTSERVHMFGDQGVGVVRAGTIVLHPLVKQTGSDVVSVASLQVPDNAKKNFQKGQEQEKKGKWAAARDYFRKAVNAYPRYAVAWLELGRTQVKQNDFADAQQSFHRAAQQDPQFLDAYIQMASLAAENRQWKELADATDRIVQLSPDSSASFWFLNSAAYFNLGNIGQAETSVTRGLRLDPDHKVPELEYLYGIILARRGDYKGASTHIENYLHLSPNAKDALDAQNKLAALQKMAAPGTGGTH